MGHFHRVARRTRGTVTGAFASDAGLSRPWVRAACWLLGLGPFFFLSYGFANWLAGLHAEVGSVVFSWERGIPFLPWTIIPYWSIERTLWDFAVRLHDETGNWIPTRFAC